MPSPKKSKKDTGPPVLDNRKARFRFHITEKIESGIVLLGSEVKSLREGKGNISEAYVVAKNRELYLINSHVQLYKNAGHFNHEETRSRKLLLKKSEIGRLKIQIEAKRFSLVPLRLYFNAKGRVKLMLGLGHGKKLFDKRQIEREAEVNREVERNLREVQKKYPSQ